MSTFTETYLEETARIVAALDRAAIDRVADALAEVRARGGRLFVLGVGGSAAHASHAVCDFRKLCGIEAYAPTDNAAELTARTNDEGWETVFASWLAGARLDARDGVLVFSVGGGSVEQGVSANLVRGIDSARDAGATVLGIVGRDGGYTLAAADSCILVPVVHDDRITPHTEGICAVLWHLLVSHPVLARATPKWESLR
jgi:D-sedoheptulose 7-phosphate isomerase